MTLSLELWDQCTSFKVTLKRRRVITKFPFLHNVSLPSSLSSGALDILYIAQPLQAQGDPMNSQLSINQHLSNFISKTGEQNNKLALSVVCLCLQLISMAAAAVVQAVSTLQKIKSLANYRSISLLSWK